MKKEKIYYNFDGEIISSKEILQRVSEEGSIKLEDNIFIQTKENLLFNYEETLKEYEKSVCEDPDDDLTQAEFEMLKYHDYAGSPYWITNGSNEKQIAIKHPNELDKYICKNKLFDIVNR